MDPAEDLLCTLKTKKTTTVCIFFPLWADHLSFQYIFVALADTFILVMSLTVRACFTKNNRQTTAGRSRAAARQQNHRRTRQTSSRRSVWTAARVNWNREERHWTALKRSLARWFLFVLDHIAACFYFVNQTQTSFIWQQRIFSLNTLWSTRMLEKDTCIRTIIYSTCPCNKIFCRVNLWKQKSGKK